MQANMIEKDRFIKMCISGSCPRRNQKSKRCKLESRQEACYKKYQKVETGKYKRAKERQNLKRTPIKQKAPTRSKNHNDRVQLLRKAIFKRDSFTCQACGATDHHITMAHRIKQGEGSIKYIKKYAIMKFQRELTTDQIDMIINNPRNVVTACTGACNDSFNIFNKEVIRNQLLDAMLEDAGFVTTKKEIKE